jgi:hypothetical protein
MNVKYKIGDRVRLKKSSEYYPRQSGGKDGTIKSFEYESYKSKYPSGHNIDYDNDDTHYFQIYWDNGNNKCYRICDIEPAVVATRIPIPEVDSYVKVIDPNFEGTMYVQVTHGLSMESDERLRGYGNLINFSKEVKFVSSVSIYHEKENRRFQPMNNREIVWMNYCLKVDNYISYDLWKPSANDLLKIEVLDRYPNLKVGERFGFVDDQSVKSIHPRGWTVGSDYIYLAPSGAGGAKVFESGKWAERSRYMATIDPYKDDEEEFKSSSWCVICNPHAEGQKELREWRGSGWGREGYLDNTRWWTKDKPAKKHLISYQTFLDKVYYPYKGMKPPVKENSFNVNDIVQAVDTYGSAAFQIGEVFRVKNIEEEHIWIKIGESQRKEPAKYFKKIELIGKKIRIMKDDLHSADVKKDDVLIINLISDDCIIADGWAFPYSFINKHDKLVLVDDQKVQPIPVMVTSSSTTHLPYLNIGTKEKRTSFIEDVEPIKIKMSKRVPNKLKIN